jgi:hypothetical protein
VYVSAFDAGWEGHESATYEVMETPHGPLYRGFRRMFDALLGEAEQGIWQGGRPVIEAESKARVQDPEAVRAALDKRATGRAEVYQDTYYDDPAGSLAAGDRELRVHRTSGGSGQRGGSSPRIAESTTSTMAISAKSGTTMSTSSWQVTATSRVRPTLSRAASRTRLRARAFPRSVTSTAAAAGPSTAP